MTDRNEAIRLAEWIEDDMSCQGDAEVAAMLRQQAERIAELEGECDKLTQGIAQGLDSQTLLTDIALRDGGLYAGIEGGAAGLLAAGFAEQFVEAGGINYVEVSFTHPKTGPLVVTLQRTQGKTPHKLRVEAEAERDQLRAEVERLKPNAERWEYALNSEEFAVCEWGTVFGEPCWVPISEESAIDAARTTHKETE